MATDTLDMAGADPHDSGSRAVVPTAILVLAAFYAVSLLLGWPQYGTKQIVEQASHSASHDTVSDETLHETAAADAAHADPIAHEAGHDAPHAMVAPPLWAVVPFVLLLGAIAVLPLIPDTQHWWESNANRFKVAMGLGLVTIGYYAFVHQAPIEGHWPSHYVIEPTDALVQHGFVRAILENAIMQEYIPFIVLLFSLYTISGGIRIKGDLLANPMTNASIMGVGGLMASFVGTTGAAMLLIRLLLETNKERKHVAHTVVFFIFIVCNCGGCLLPIGDPPLFLGYLHGVDFWWTLGLWKPWLLVNGMLLGAYLLIDEFVYFRQETKADIGRDAARVHKMKFSGWKLNILLLGGVVLAVALLDPSKTFPGTHWHPWMYLREMVQLVLVAISLWWGCSTSRANNKFNYHAILEVAALFIGIFICMQPALQILRVYGNQLGIDTPMKFFWITGGLSSVLDNAPTYLVFFETAQSMPVEEGAKMVAGIHEPFLIAISLGAVFMGAMTYIGNGPNFMVKAIAEKSGVEMPSFFGFMVYSCVILLPILGFAAWRFMM